MAPCSLSGVVYVLDIVVPLGCGQGVYPRSNEAWVQSVPVAVANVALVGVCMHGSVLGTVGTLLW